MGRKRSSKKRDLKLSVDGEIIDELNYFKENKSKLFTDASIFRLEELKKKKENGQKD